MLLNDELESINGDSESETDVVIFIHLRIYNNRLCNVCNKKYWSAVVHATEVPWAQSQKPKEKRNGSRQLLIGQVHIFQLEMYWIRYWFWEHKVTIDNVLRIHKVVNECIHFNILNNKSKLHLNKTIKVGKLL